LRSNGDLLDINVWLALALSAHPHHRKALAVWPDFNRPAFCRVTQLGLLRLLGNEAVMGDRALDMDGAWKTYECIRTDAEVRMLDEPVAIETEWKRLTKGRAWSPSSWTDSYLAAFASAGGNRLVTLDKGFSRFRELDLLIIR
jgi:toxin-antitoxin system PIN domain toxin